MQEIWKSLKGIVEYGDYYEVSNLGRVKSVDRVVCCGNGFKRINGRMRKLKTEKNGYTSISLSYNGKSKTYKVHRLVALAFIHNPENKPEVNHKDGNKSNNLASNLEWVTVSENTQHAYDNGLAKGRNGETHHNSILKEEDVLEIIGLWESGKYTKKEISKKFNISHMAVIRILNGDRWSYLGYKSNKRNKPKKSLTDKQKKIVKDLYVNKKSHTQQQLADMFDVSRATIQRAIKEC